MHTNDNLKCQYHVVEEDEKSTIYYMTNSGTSGIKTVDQVDLKITDIKDYLSETLAIEREHLDVEDGGTSVKFFIDNRFKG